ncbi:ribonuclease R [bacterium]|nr:MAG: ribonuclease R [bacterium]
MMPSREEIVSFLLDSAPSPMTALELRERFSVAETEAPRFLALLSELVTEGRAVEIKGGRYAHPSRVGLVVGRISMHRDGFGFVDRRESGAPDLFVGNRELAGAMHGDMVIARVEKSGPKPSGSVIRILKRGTERIIGKVRMRGKYALVAPLDERFNENVYVHLDDLGGAVDGQLVQVELTAYPSQGEPPAGIVVHVLGYQGDKDAEAGAIALKHKVRIDFPDTVLRDAEKFPRKVAAADISGREDLRFVPFVTIDGEKAKDFDDAVHVEEGPGGSLILRVAIADVSHYVVPGTPVDSEALLRGTSTYFPDRVFPMLPEALSNNLCSLVPREDRLTMVAQMEFTKGGRRKAQRFFPAVIRSVHRLTYNKVARILDDPDCEEATVYADVADGLHRMWSLASLIRARRKERGSIDFDLPEAEIILDISGRPEDIVRSERNRAHYLIEEFMIAANEAVAEFLEDKGIPAPFRIHEEPDAGKVEEFKKFIHNFGYFIRTEGKLKPGDFQALVEKTEGKPEARMINQVMLRTMKKAVYHYENLGHFGLASTHYLHFTSPIRRYPDLFVHRILKMAIKPKGIPKKKKEELREMLSVECPRLSDCERGSEAAEREAVAWKKCQFMADKVGERYWGFVTGVATFGFFVELEQYFVEGLVHVSSLKDDFYHYNEEQQTLMGERGRRTFRIGDRIEVILERVDESRRQIDFTVLPPPELPVSRETKPGSREFPGQREARGRKPKEGERGPGEQKPREQKPGEPKAREQRGRRRGKKR